MLIGEQLVQIVSGRTLIDQVNIRVKPGTATALIGPNGAGKTLLLHALSLVNPPTSGRVIIEDREFRFPATEVRRPPWPFLTVVFQQLFLWPHMTIRDNIWLPVQKVRVTSDHPEMFAQLTETFALKNLLDKYPNQTSLGERQRVALARALLLKPRYLLLDEITSAQDVEYIQVILHYLEELKRSGVGLLFVTHLLGFAGRLADEIHFLDNGEIVESGSVSILSSPRTERMRRFVSLIEYLNQE